MKTFQLLKLIPSSGLVRNHVDVIKKQILDAMISKDNLYLGRWEHRENENQKEIKSIWANSDNCGDRICGQPDVIKEITNIWKN